MESEARAGSPRSDEGALFTRSREAAQGNKVAIRPSRPAIAGVLRSQHRAKQGCGVAARTQGGRGTHGCRVGESILGTGMSQNLSRGSDTLVCFSLGRGRERPRAAWARHGPCGRAGTEGGEPTRAGVLRCARQNLQRVRALNQQAGARRQDAARAAEGGGAVPRCARLRSPSQSRRDSTGRISPPPKCTGDNDEELGLDPFRNAAGCSTFPGYAQELAPDEVAVFDGSSARLPRQSGARAERCGLGRVLGVARLAGRAGIRSLHRLFDR